MFILKVTMVPILIAVVTLAGRRWGAGIAGLLAGFPVVAGPVILVAVEQGAERNFFLSLGGTLAPYRVLERMYPGCNGRYCSPSCRSVAGMA